MQENEIDAAPVAAIGKLLPIVSREEAKERGLKRYFTGKPCKHGHVAQRQTSDTHCFDCKRDTKRRWRESNREKALEYNRQWNSKNPDKRRDINRRHRAANPEYGSWHSMIARCTNPRYDSFHDYGGRGITVCDRWRYGENGMSGFECFISDMGPRPSPNHSLDRIDPNGNYEPGSVRWATAKEQANNRNPPRPRKLAEAA
jgi:hypothetical protein